MALPPWSVLLICVLSVIDIITTIVGATGAATFAILAAGNPDTASVFWGWGVVIGLWALAKIAALVGLRFARRWAVVLGAMSFHLPIPAQWSGGLGLMLFVPIASIGFFLACTLPHWQRMTWRFP